MKKYKDERDQLTQAWEQEKAKMKEVEEELKTNNNNFQKKLEAQAVMEKDMNVSFLWIGVTELLPPLIVPPQLECLKIYSNWI